MEELSEDAYGDIVQVQGNNAEAEAVFLMDATSEIQRLSSIHDRG